MSNQSSFNPEAFMASANVEDALDTVTKPIPEGAYTAQVDKIEFNQVERQDGTTSVVCNVNWELLDDALKAEMERDRVFARQQLWLDTDENGALDTGKGKNVGLGRLRDALGINTAGNAFEGLVGKLATVRVSQSSDKKDPTIKYSNVTRVTAIE